MKKLVLHGVVKGFAPWIEEHGIEPLDPKAGVLVRDRLDDAVKDARASAAYYWQERRAEPIGILVLAIVERERLWIRNGLLRVDRILPAEVKLSKPIEFPEFSPEIGEGHIRRVYAPDREGNAIERALHDFAELQRLGAPFKPATEVKGEA